MVTRTLKPESIVESLLAETGTTRALPAMNFLKKFKLVAGDPVMAGYDGDISECKFLGFTDNDENHSSPGHNSPKYKSLSDLFQAKSVSTIDELEVLEEAPKGFVRRFYMLFEEKEGELWSAYINKGEWSVGPGSKPSRLKLAPL